MSVPQWALLGFATWTLLLLLATVGVYRWSRILTGRQPIRSFRADEVQGRDWYKRAMRAHINCVENLPVFAVIVFALHVSELSGSWVDRLAVAILVARICQSLVHVAFTQTNAAVSLRFTFFFVQLVGFAVLIAMIVAHSLDSEPAGAAAAPAVPLPVEEPDSFVDRVWRADDAQQMEEGSRRVFLSGGTLVMASPHAEPAFGSWRRDGAGLIITEEGIDYRTEILEQRDDSLRLRLHSPGEPVELTLVPAGAAAGIARPAAALVAPPVFEARGNEPFWYLEIVKGDRATFRRPDEADVVTPAPSPTRGDDRSIRYHAVTESADVRITVEPGPCADSMSGRVYATSVSVLANGTRYEGCGQSAAREPSR